MKKSELTPVPEKPKEESKPLSPPSHVQNVTERYVRHLLRAGNNKDFYLNVIGERESLHDEIVVGRFFEAIVMNSMRDRHEVATGVTPTQAVRRALIKHGVTFR